MQITHFSKLASHRLPVLQLFRRLLRHAGHLPLENEQCVLARRFIADEFRRNRPMMSGHIARNQINEGYRWEEVLREVILEKRGTSEVVEELAKRRLIPQATEPTIGKTPPSSKEHLPLQYKRAAQFNASGQMAPSDPLYDYHRQNTTLMTRRDKTVKRLQARNYLPKKSKLDPVYIDTFLAPQEYQKRQQHHMERKRARHLAGPPRARISFLQTPRGPFSYLKIPGQERTVRTNRGRHIRRLLADTQLTKLRSFDSEISLAQQEAEWESLCGTEESLDTLVEQWTGPLVEARQQLVEKRQAQKSALLEYRDVLIRQKAQVDRELAARHEAARARWASYKPPILHAGRISRGTAVR